MSSGLIIPNAPPSNCGNCRWAATLPDLNLIECTSMPPTPVVVGMVQAVAGPAFNIQAMRPNLPRTLAACSLFERKVAKE